ncbi:Retrovirus-related Pol polyprotein from transposon opus, partial [Mucuna pruriens]
MGNILLQGNAFRTQECQSDISKGYVYMDDMIAKSRTLDQHVEDLRKLFERLPKYRLRLNPVKCTFELLGFIVNEKVIEVDPDEVKAIRNMPPPKTETEVRGFLGRVNYIARVLRSLQKGQAILGNTCPRPDNTREAPNPLPNSAGRINGLHSGAARCLKEERTRHILSQQEIHTLRTKIPNIGVNLLCSSLDDKKVYTIHVGPYYMAHSQDGPPQVYL